MHDNDVAYKEIYSETRQKAFFKKKRSQEYEEIYRKDVLPIFRAFEHLRLETLHKFYRKSFLKYFLPIIITICASLLLSRANPSIDFLIPLVCCSLLLFSLILEFYWPARKKENSNFSNMMKKRVLRDLLSVFGNIKWIEHNVCKKNLKDVLLTDKQLNGSGLFVYYNTRFTDFLIELKR